MLNRSSDHPGYDEMTPVLIVGGSLIGLSTSLFLSRQGIASLLVERHASTAIHPRVASLTARTMEIFRAAEAESAIRQIEPPFSSDSNVPLVESLVGQEFDHLMEDMSAYFTPASPVRGSLIAQDVLESALPALAVQAGGDLRYGTELIGFEQDDEGVTATIQERANGSTRSVRALFLVAADGGKSEIRQQLGIGQHGTGSLGHYISIIFEADIMELFHKHHAVLCFLSNDSVSGALSPYPGSSVRPDIYRLDVGYDPEEETLTDYPEARCLQLIRAAVGIPGLAAQIKTVLTWEMAARVADRFQEGRVFLVGDAARVQPPSGALGGNTGIAEAHNLAWKLAAVLRGEADQRLLGTYDTERRPLADYTSEQAVLLSQQRANEGSEGITVNTLIINMGYRYRAGALVREEDDGHLPLVQHPDRWTGQPGTRAPHVILERRGEPISTLDLFVSHFVLLAARDGQNWLEAARRSQNVLHLPLDIYQIGGDAGDLSDAGNTLPDAYGITASGAVIVRPNGFIGWRSRDAVEKQQEAEQALTQALSTLLFR
ncbi:MAG: FAD-dependent monooxygenase [Dehalococcoidia bacterium]